MITRTGILTIALIAISPIVKAQQDPQFSQNMYNHITVNPAFAGEQNRWMISGIYRNQWQSMDGAPETYAFNVDGPLRIKGTDGGIGFNMMSDKLGMQTFLHLMLDYSYKRTIRPGVLSVGMKFGIVNEKIEGEYHIPDGNPADDPALNKESVSKILFDMGLGAFLTGDRFYAGIALSHLTKPTFTLGETGELFLAPHLYMTGGYTLPIAARWDLQPSAFVKTDFVSTQYSINMNAVFNKMYWGGVSYRYEEALIFMGGLELKNGIMVGYSYDWNVSDVGKYTGGSHEVTLSYSFGLKLGKRQKIYKSVRFL
ncbi:MAG: type IX secretion system membrane protein PorP/SprF [Odoribacter sp.]